MEQKPVKKIIRSSQLKIYAIALLATGAVSELIWTVFNAVHRNRELPWNVCFGLALFVAAMLIFRRLKKDLPEKPDVSQEDRLFLCALHDQYLKRLLHAIALFIAAFAVFIGAELSFYFFGNSKAAELGQNMPTHNGLIRRPLYLLLENILVMRLLIR